MKLSYVPLYILLLLTADGLIAQETTFRSTRFEHKIKKTFDPQNFTPGYAVELKNLVAPTPGGDSYRSFMMRVKAASAEKYPRKASSAKSAIDQSAPAPLDLGGFTMIRYIPSLDTIVPIFGGTPLDNTMAISNDGMLLGSVNSLLYGYDLNADSILFTTPTDYISFEDFADDIGTDFPFDPKLLYDPQEDRFVFVFLSGRAPGDSKIIVGFSSSGNPTDPWSVYELSGNPLNNNRWTDYPAIALTDKELFITINLLIPGQPWQTGFSESIIWQVDKSDGYSGEDSLSSRLWHDIGFNGRPLRNLNPVQGGKSPLGPNIFLLSNRNFAIENDSIFVVEVTNTMDAPDATLHVQLGLTNTPYGAPPNGIQANSVPITDSTGFDTNDGRVLGGFLHDNEIQFVSNTKNFDNGRAAVYHGFIRNPGTPQMTVTGNVISEDNIDFGYPNIVWAGKADCDHEAIIGFNHTSDTIFAGTSAIYYSNFDNYSPVIRLKEGDNFVERIPGPYERWGDYFGIQRIYNEPGKIWTAGFYGYVNQSSTTWFAQLQSPDSNVMAIDFDTTIFGANNCAGQLTASVSGGNEPYTLSWNGNTTTQTTFPINLCEDEYEFIVTDEAGCKITAQGKFDANRTSLDIYPNPVTERVHLNFEFGEDLDVVVSLYNVNGQLVRELLNQRVTGGLNIFSFSTLPLATGTYILTITSGDRQLFREKLVKQ